ncbi:MAG: TIGR03943 family protein [Microbacteriaceae bacterium]|nr:TIGR03943 family protein [Microbacteriaceae bacterium]
MFKQKLNWILACAGAVGCLVLVFSGKLSLYVHPRYTWFTLLMALIAVPLLCFAAGQAARQKAPRQHGDEVASVGGDDSGDEKCDSVGDAQTAGALGSSANGSVSGDTDSSDAADSEKTHASTNLTPAAGARGAARLRPGALLAGACGALLLAPLILLPPAPLSSQRAIAAAGTPAGVPGGVSSPAANHSSASDSEKTVLDWAQILSVTTDPAQLAGRSANLLGFITADPDDPENLVRVSRYSITCCIVDTQAIGVTVYMPGWQAHFKEGDWVKMRGHFIQNPSVLSPHLTVFTPEKHEKTQVPADPYLTGGGK